MADLKPKIQAQDPSLPPPAMPEASAPQPGQLSEDQKNAEQASQIQQPMPPQSEVKVVGDPGIVTTAAQSVIINPGEPAQPVSPPEQQQKQGNQ